MSLFSWLTGDKKKPSKAKTRHPDPVDSVMYEAGMEFGTMPERKPAAPSSQQAVMNAAEQAIEQRRQQRKADRMGRREALFGIVRESMLRAGILSSAYKFKVLSIDQKGRHFLVLLDLSLDLARTEPASRLLEIEKMIVESAQNRVQVTVQAVYWRHYQAAPAAGATASGAAGMKSPLRAAAAARAAAAEAPTGESLTAALGSSARFLPLWQRHAKKCRLVLWLAPRLTAATLNQARPVPARWQRRRPILRPRCLYRKAISSPWPINLPLPTRKFSIARAMIWATMKWRLSSAP